jgi:hypothetical protein
LEKAQNVQVCTQRFVSAQGGEDGGHAAEQREARCRECARGAQRGARAGAQPRQGYRCSRTVDVPTDRERDTAAAHRAPQLVRRRADRGRVSAARAQERGNLALVERAPAFDDGAERRADGGADGGRAPPVGALGEARAARQKGAVVERGRRL